MLRHVMLVKRKPHTTQAQIEKAQRAFSLAVSRIEGLEDYEWGENNSPEQKNAGYDICILMTFTDEAARDYYLPHPEHDFLKVDFAPIIDDIIVFDYSV